jgi:ADP-ribose pyrophosphatase YjhB (NUDIX family)
MEYHHFIRKVAGKSPIILTAAGVVITNAKGQLLLFKRSESGVWSIPGGHMDIGESLEETAIRETFEETGLTLYQLELICVVSGKNSCIENDDGTKTYYVTAIFKCNEFSGSLQGSSEGEEVDFFDVDNLPSPVSTSARGAVDYLRQLETSIF